MYNLGSCAWKFGIQLWDSIQVLRFGLTIQIFRLQISDFRLLPVTAERLSRIPEGVCWFNCVPLYLREVNLLVRVYRRWPMASEQSITIARIFFLVECQTLDQPPPISVLTTLCQLLNLWQFYTDNRKDIARCLCNGATFKKERKMLISAKATRVFMHHKSFRLRSRSR